MQNGIKSKDIEIALSVLDLNCSSSCIRSVGFFKLQLVCENQQLDICRLAVSCVNLSACIKSVDNLQQTCYHVARASDGNAS